MTGNFGGQQLLAIAIVTIRIQPRLLPQIHRQIVHDTNRAVVHQPAVKVRYMLALFINLLQFLCGLDEVRGLVLWPYTRFHKRETVLVISGGVIFAGGLFCEGFWWGQEEVVAFLIGWRLLSEGVGVVGVV